MEDLLSWECRCWGGSVRDGGGLVPFLDQVDQWHGGFDGSRDLVEHEFEVTLGAV